MLVALDKNGKLVNLLEGLPARGEFFCPACHGAVRLKCGTVKMAHFAHLSLQDCQAWSENESAQHLALKKSLYDWFVKFDRVEVEHYLPELAQTPDLLVNGRIAIEVQCSHLSIARLRERTENYRAHGYTVLWLLGRDLWLKRSLTALQRQLLYFSENAGFYAWELDLTGRELRLKSLLHEDLRGALSNLTESFAFGQGNLLEILRRPFARQVLKSLTVTRQGDELYFVRGQLFHRSAKWLRLQEKYYERGQNLLSVKFDRNFQAPVGLNLLAVKFDGLPSHNFCQISQDLRPYYQNFYENWSRKPLRKLYPPAFYDKMKSKIEKER